MHNEHDTNHGIIAWFARNSVAANLLMIFIVVMGLAAYTGLQRQMFPMAEFNYIRISASYPGASPQEIEEGIIVKIEEALKDVPEVERVVSRAFRGSGSLRLTIDEKASLANVLDKVNLRVDGIASFPADMEPVTIVQEEFTQQVIELPLVGDLPLSLIHI